MRKIIFICVLLFLLPYFLSAQQPDIKIPRNASELEAVLNKAKNGTYKEKGECRYILGYCFQNGVLGEKNINTAVDWYILSASFDYVPSWIALARIYEEAGDPYSSLRSYYKAALLGSKPAEKELVEIFEEDEDLIAGHYLSLLYLEKGDMQAFMPVAYINARKGDIVIQMEISEYLMNKHAGDKEKFLEGYSLLEKIAVSDSLNIMHNMADKLGVQYDDAGMRKWYEQNADDTMTKARSKLGTLYLNGTEYTKSDPRKAFNLLLKAAVKYDMDAMEGLVKCYSEGLGVNKDTDKVKYWNDMIDENGDYEFLQFLSF